MYVKRHKQITTNNNNKSLPHTVGPDHTAAKDDQRREIKAKINFK